VLFQGEGLWLKDRNPVPIFPFSLSAQGHQAVDAEAFFVPGMDIGHIFFNKRYQGAFALRHLIVPALKRAVTPRTTLQHSLLHWIVLLGFIQPGHLFCPIWRAKLKKDQGP